MTVKKTTYKPARTSERIVVLGAGESGTGAAILAGRKGYDVFVSDLNSIKPKYAELLNKYSIKWEEKKHSEKQILNATEIIKSPGIPDSAPIIKKILAAGIPIISEIEFASRYTNAKLIGITGSNGKTTTTLLIYHILQKAGLKAGLAGNVGKSFALQVAEEENDYYVIELSSFQLDDMHRFKADVAILLNITPDHLDRYGYKFQNYVSSKFRIIQNLTENDCFIYCSDDEAIITELKKHDTKMKLLPFSIKHPEPEGGYATETNLIINQNHNPFIMSIHDLALQGKHNTYNSLAAAIAANVFQIRKDIIRESLVDFQGVEHRLEPVVKVHGIEFINDSKATNVNSSWYALESMKTSVVWIVGGIDKGNDYSMLDDLVKKRVKAIVCLGTDNSKIHKAFDGLVPVIQDCASMKEAVNASYHLAKKGDTVLLSPCCASFDLFESYEDRGRQFKKAVREL